MQTSGFMSRPDHPGIFKGRWDDRYETILYPGRTYRLEQKYSSGILGRRPARIRVTPKIAFVLDDIFWEIIDVKIEGE